MDNLNLITSDFVFSGNFDGCLPQKVGVSVPVLKRNGPVGTVHGGKNGGIGCIAGQKTGTAVSTPDFVDMRAFISAHILVRCLPQFQLKIDNSE